jgi:hypothetical protein
MSLKTRDITEASSNEESSNESTSMYSHSYRAERKRGKFSKMEMVVSSPEAFGEILVCPDLLHDHLPGSYDKALSALRDTLMLNS